MDTLKRTTIREAVGDADQRPLYYVETGTSLRQVLDTLHTRRILSLPVVEVDPRTGAGFQHVEGLIDVLDLVAYTTHSFHILQGHGPYDNAHLPPDLLRQFLLEGRTASDVLDVSARTRDFKIITDDATLGELAAVMGKEGEHRVLLPPQRGHPVTLLSQRDVVRWLHRHAGKIDNKILGTPVGQLDIPKKVLNVAYHKLAISAYWHILRHNVSAVAVIDENGKLLDTLSASDLRGINDENLHTLTLPVSQFLASCQSRKPTAELVRCSPNDQLGTAIDKLVESQGHRLWLTDESEKPVGVLSLTDVIRTMLS